MGRKVNVTLYYELFLNDEDEAAYKAVDKDCDPDLILFWSKLCREHGVIVGCNDVQLPPMTNADRIRAKSDEELADWLGVYCNGQTAQEVGKPCASGMGSCEECWLDWLKGEAEGDT